MKKILFLVSLVSFAGQPVSALETKAKKTLRVLIVLTSHGALGNTGKKTGYYLSEVTHPYYKITAAGIDVDFASPQGGSAPMDERSIKEADPENSKFLADLKLSSRLKNTLKLSVVKAGDYSAIVFAGGHGAMWDFSTDAAVARISREIYENGGVVSAVCHGPASLLNIKLTDGAFLIQGKKLTGFSNGEEKAVQLQDVVPFSLENELKKKGAIYYSVPNWGVNVVTDGRLITGQNPQSASLLGETIVKVLLHSK